MAAGPSGAGKAHMWRNEAEGKADEWWKKLGVEEGGLGMVNLAQVHVDL